MMNSRTRRSPPRGRGSSRSLTEKWYQSCGSSLYDWISRAWNVNVSSWVSGRTKRRPLRSVTWKISGILSRPVASQSSTGVSSGARNSWPPIASISSRMICSTLRWIRQPSGRYVQSPALTWRTKPPRTRSLWLTASASAGSSRRVGKKSCDALAANVRQPSYSSGISDASAIASAAGLAIFRRFGRCMPSAIHLSISKKSSSIRMSDETFFSTRPWA